MRAEAATMKHERRLIEAALRDAKSATSATAWRVADGDHAGALPPDAFPGYELLRELHRGGQGIVYQAIQKSTKRKVALKVLLAGPFAGTRDRVRFDREVQVLGQLQHPNVVSIHDSGVADGRFYYVMDYIAGPSLDEHVRSRGGAIDDTLEIVATIAEAVHAAHLRGVVHRDLKPANIRIDTAGAPHVLDFGLAKVAAAEVVDGPRPEIMTMRGQFIGSLPWASPEQAEGRPDKVDPRTDVYALGVILYELLTGRFPYEVTGSMREALQNIVSATPISPRSLRREINDEVATIVLKCLRKERDRRYQSAGDLARDIRRYLAGAPIEAKRDSGGYVLRKTLMRHKVPTAIGAMLLVGGIVFGITMSLLFLQASVAHEEAVDHSRRLASMLGLLDPKQGRDIDHELVRSNVAEWEISLAERPGPPELETPARLCLGRAYINLGQYADAERHFRRAVELQRGSGNREALAETLHNVAWALTEQQASEAAETCYLEAIQLRAELAPESLAYAETSNDLGMLYLEQKDFRAAEPHLRRALAIRENDPTASVVDRVESMATLGELLLRIGDEESLAESETLLQSALDLARDQLGEHTYRAAVMNKVGLLHLEQRDYEGALARFEAAIELRMRLLPPTHPHVAATRFNLALAHRGLGEYDEAIEYHDEAIAIWEALGHRYLAPGLMGLAETMRRSGDAEAAGEYAREALLVAEQRSEPDPASIAEIQYVHARALMDLDDHAAALAHAEESHDWFFAEDPDGWKAARGSAAVGRCLTMLDRLDEAGEALENGCAPLRRIRGPDDRDAREAEAWRADWVEWASAGDA